MSMKTCHAEEADILMKRMSIVKAMMESYNQENPPAVEDEYLSMPEMRTRNLKPRNTCC